MQWAMGTSTLETQLNVWARQVLINRTLTLMALAMAVLVDNTVMSGTLLRSLILPQVSFTLSDMGQRLILVNSKVAKCLDGGSP